jgi:hypothetical protein
MVIRLPDPQTASGRGLGRWLVQRDLSGEPEDTQRALVERLLIALRNGEFPAPGDEGGKFELSDAQKTRLAQNVQLLKRVWFFGRVDQLEQVPAAERDGYLDDQLATVASLSAWDTAIWEQETEATPDRAEAGFGLMQDLDAWIAETSGNRQQQVVQAVSWGVTRWLMTSDLSQQSFAVRSELANRIAHRLDEGTKAAELLDEPSPGERDCLRANAQLLLEAWFHDCAKHHGELPAAQQQAAYVDRQIDRLESWDILALLADESDQTGGHAAAAQIVGLVNGWIERAPAEQKSALQQFFLAVQQRYFLRMLQPG